MLSINDKGNQPILFTLPVEKSKHKFEYQELCSELEPTYGKRIWTVPHMVGFTEYKIRKAHEVCQKRGILTINYLIGVLKKL